MQLASELQDCSIVDTVPMDCELVLAGARERLAGTPTKLGKRELLTVATSYPMLLGEFATSMGLNLRVNWQPSGGCEAYASTGRSDLIFDIRKTGDTLKANNLVVYRASEKLNLFVLRAASVVCPARSDVEVDLEKVAMTLLDRYLQAQRDTGESYTAMLFKDRNKQVKKLGEEFAELFQAFMRRPTQREEIVSEAADLLYAIQLLLTVEGLTLRDVIDEDIKRNQP